MYQYYSTVVTTSISTTTTETNRDKGGFKCPVLGVLLIYDLLAKVFASLSVLVGFGNRNTHPLL